MDRMKQKIKNLWKLCFNDSEEFVEMYFRLRYHNDVNIAIESGEEVIAALQMLPYPMTFGGKKSKHLIFPELVRIPPIAIRERWAHCCRKHLCVCWTVALPYLL